MPGIKTLLARLKRKFFKKPFLKDRHYPAYWMDQSLAGQEVTMVQIGSNDGKTGDPFFPLLQKNKSWSALFVEPDPQSFARLTFNYGTAPRFRFENVAINEGQKMTFYTVDKSAKDNIPNLPYWYDQLGSFDKQHILKHFDGALAPYIIPLDLEGITLQHLFDRNKITALDILHIDTEGYDWKILAQLDLSKYQPRFILFEHNHLTPNDKAAAVEFLEKHYNLFDLGIDFFAVHKNNGRSLYQRMSQYMKPVL